MGKTLELLIALVAIGLFGGLIIYVTPQIYRIHPINQENDSISVAPSVQHFEFFDTLYLQNDTIISHRDIVSTIGESSSDSPMADLGTFGDSAGFWNAIFSGLAMLGVIITIYYQRTKDRESDDRDRISKFQEQCLTMISMLSEIVVQLKISTVDRTPTQIYTTVLHTNYWPQASASSEDSMASSLNSYNITGRACFKYIYDERPNGRCLRDFISKSEVVNQGLPRDEEFYTSLRKVTENHFEHYFRTIYRILKFIKDSDLGNVDPKKQSEIRENCADLLRAQLSSYELAILYYNGLHRDFKNTSKKMYEYYSIFDNLIPDLLILDAEKEYYKRIIQDKNNGQDYDSSIHYDYTAFVSKSPSKVKGENSVSRLDKIINWLSKGCELISKWRKTEQTTILSNDLTTYDKRILDILKSHGEKPISKKTLSNQSQLNVKRLTESLERLEREGYIAIKHGSHGVSYRISKGYDNMHND